MTPKDTSAPPAAPTAAKIRPSRGIPAARSEAAPALFRLLSDSTLYRAAFTGCGFPMAIVDALAAGHAVVQVNPAFESAFGYGEAELRGQPFGAALCRGTSEAAERLFAHPGAHEQLRVARKDGSVVEVTACASPVRNERGVQTHWVLAFAGWGKPVAP